VSVAEGKIAQPAVARSCAWSATSNGVPIFLYHGLRGSQASEFLSVTGKLGTWDTTCRLKSRQPGLQPLCLYVCVSERVCLDTDKTPREANSGR
ncbi:MAG: hypothetical protein ACPIOQ_68980, partial [Promethearchaeia archaeon]